jgi:hypothetical protein
MVQLKKLGLVLFLLSDQALAMTGVCLAQPMQPWRIELVSTWGICGKDIVLAKGTIEVNILGSANGRLTFYDGGKASFVTKLSKPDRISVHSSERTGRASRWKAYCPRQDRKARGHPELCPAVVNGMPRRLEDDDGS